MVKVHYFFDPMCGWCYGATPLIEVLEQASNIKLLFHPGGMISKQRIESSFRHHIVESDKHIAQLTGATFGQVYKDRITGSEDIVLDSFLPIRAFIVGVKLGANPVHLLKAIQSAHYMDGAQIEKVETLAAIALSFKLDGAIWQQQMHETAPQVSATIAESQKLMQQHTVRGYPTLMVETNGQWIPLPYSSYYGKSGEWRAYVNSLDALFS